MNIAHFQILLQKAIDNATKTVDYLLLSRALKSLNVGQIRTVFTFGDLPSAASNEGLLVFVTADERLYWSTGTYWYNIVTNDNEEIVYAWGRNCASAGSGRLGDGTIVNRSSPVSVIGGFTDWCQVSGGYVHSLGVRSNGTAWAWGNNCSGRLGDGTTVTKSSPVSVIGGFTDWCQVSAGDNHSLGVRCNGTAWAWGLNSVGFLGDGTIMVNKSSPVSVIGGFTDWCQVSAGDSHSLGVRCNGTAWAWGSNVSGRLGDGTTVNRSSPVSVIGGFTDWCQVSAGFYHSLGVRTDGTAWAWGLNSVGFLGDGTTVDKSSPVSVIGGFADWCQVSAGCNHSFGLRKTDFT
jgi:alpha-tubulin suppressor-like RCC1 family protein